jgi:hypothetical protein
MPQPSVLQVRPARRADRVLLRGCCEADHPRRRRQVRQTFAFHCLPLLPRAAFQDKIPCDADDCCMLCVWHDTPVTSPSPSVAAPVLYSRGRCWPRRRVHSPSRRPGSRRQRTQMQLVPTSRHCSSDGAQALCERTRGLCADSRFCLVHHPNPVLPCVPSRTLSLVKLMARVQRNEARLFG